MAIDLFSSCDGVPPGWVQAFLGAAIPAGWIPLDGRAAVIAENPALYAMLGDAYSNFVDEPTFRATAASVIPVMTSNTAPSGTASASSIYSTSYDAWMAFNGNASQSWLASGTTSGWVQYAFPPDQMRYICSYTIKPRVASSDISAPRDWTLKGSVDGTTWITLDQRAAVSSWLGDGTGLTFDLDASKLSDAYRYFRLDITAKHTGGTYLGVGELTLMGLSALPVIDAPAGSFGLPNIRYIPTPIPGGVWCIKAG